MQGDPSHTVHRDTTCHQLPDPARSQVTCVEAPLGAACPSYGEAAVAQVTELGEGGGGVDGISPGSKGICG